MSSGSGLYFPLDSLPPRLRAQAEAQLRPDNGRTQRRAVLPSIHTAYGGIERPQSSFRVMHAPSSGSQVEEAGERTQPKEEASKPKPIRKKERTGTKAVVEMMPDAASSQSASSRGTPNRTEAEYNRAVLAGRGIYEPIVLRLPGGNYTPDWMTVDGATGRVTFHEVKGSYRFPSEGRALLAFRSAAAAFPVFRFVWAQRQKGGMREVRVPRLGTDRNP